jgi:hypothetical protein
MIQNYHNDDHQNPILHKPIPMKHHNKNNTMWAMRVLDTDMITTFIQTT